MTQSAAVIIQTACRLLAKYESEAIRYAEARAQEDGSDTGVNWPLVADTLRLLSESGLSAPT